MNFRKNNVNTVATCVFLQKTKLDVTSVCLHLGWWSWAASSFSVFCFPLHTWVLVDECVKWDSSQEDECSVVGCSFLHQSSVVKRPLGLAPSSEAGGWPIVLRDTRVEGMSTWDCFTDKKHTFVHTVMLENLWCLCPGSERDNLIRQRKQKYFTAHL